MSKELGNSPYNPWYTNRCTTRGTPLDHRRPAPFNTVNADLQWCTVVQTTWYNSVGVPVRYHSVHCATPYVNGQNGKSV